MFSFGIICIYKNSTKIYDIKLVSLDYHKYFFIMFSSDIIYTFMFFYKFSETQKN